MPLIEIDRQGDVVLQLTKSSDGSSDDSNTILVSSKVLALASPVFSAMLSPRFLEGQRSASGTLDPIALPDDDADAMTVLCHIFHFNYSALPARADLELFKNLALMCDKYDCVTPLSFISEHWLLIWEKTAKKEELEILLFISYMFDRAERFSALSTRIVMEFTGNLKHLETLGGFDVVPYELLRGLQQQRKATLKGIETSVTRQLQLMDQSSAFCFPVSSAARHCPKCWRAVASSADYCLPCHNATIPTTCSLESRRGTYVGILKEAKLEPIGLWSTMTMKSITEIAESIAVAVNGAHRHSCNATTECPLKSTFYGLRTEVEKLATGTKGLCLDCIKATRETTGLNMFHPDKPKCRVDHG